MPQGLAVCPHWGYSRAAPDRGDTCLMATPDLMPIHDPELLAQGERVLGPEFTAMSQRVLRVTALTSRLNALPFDDEAGKSALLEQILGRPLPAKATIYPPFYTDHGLRLELAEGVFINQGCTFLDYAGIRLAKGVMVGPKVTFITMGHPVDPEERHRVLTGAPIDVAENVWIGAGAMILPGVSIGRDAVVAAGAIVTDDVPARSLVAGTKAAVRRSW
jgi:acetyltransferase-like isoleucine patch superfamily enzyme